MPPTLLSPLGLIAGNGVFPLEFARSAKAKGLEVIAVAHEGETDPALAENVSKCVWIKVGQLGTILDTFKNSGVRQAAFAGGIQRVRLFGGVKLDVKGMALLARLRTKKDDEILRGVAAELEKNGITVIGANSLLESNIPQAGTLSQRGLSEAEKADGRIGFEAAKATGALDIGQTVVVYDGLVTAVEAVEGTDAALRRAGELTGKRGGVVVKLCKPQQDERMDLPSIGPKTLETMKNWGLTAIVLEAGKALILDPVKVVSLANEAKIAIRVVKDISEIG
jgi:UDP-2,3-diacylglucosamine hydrolase